MKKLGELFSDKEKRLRAILVLGIAGMLLIAISDMLPDKRGSTVTDDNPQSSLDETEQYRRSLEEQLTDIISGIEGAGRTRVMISVSAAKEYVYAEKKDTDRRTQSGEESVKSRGEPVVSGESPLLRTVLVPKVSGAAVVCEGAADPVTRERVTETVAAVLGLPSTRISVQPYGDNKDTMQE